MDLHQAIINRNPDQVRRILDATNATSALHLATSHGCDLDIITALVNSGALVNSQDSSGETPLRKVIDNSGPPEVIQVLLEAGADVSLKCHQGTSNLFQALFVPLRREKVDDDCFLLPTIVGENDVEVVKLLVNAGADVGEQDLLHLAAALPSKEIFEVLMDAGGDGYVNERNVDGDTPLHVAVRLRNKEVVEVLLKVNGVDVELENDEGLTPSQSACVNLHRLMVRDGKSLKQEDAEGLSKNSAVEAKIVKLFVDYIGESDEVNLDQEERSDELMESMLKNLFSFVKNKMIRKEKNESQVRKCTKGDNMLTYVRNLVSFATYTASIYHMFHYLIQ